MSAATPQRGDRPLRVRVPGSTSNLGPGFDLLGLALSLELEVTLEPEPDGPGGVRDEGELPGWPDGPDDLLRIAFEHVGGRSSDYALRVRSQIPIGRGFGSSGAAIAAGLLLGAAVSPEPIEREDLLRLALELEGHPDNVTPSLLGGCVIAVPLADGAVRVVRQPVHPSLAFAVAWPEAQLATRRARALLPSEVPFADAVENPRRLALLLEGLRTGEPELLRLGAEDRLHVPHRIAHVPGGAEALDAARAAGASLATLSGSGTGLFAISDGASAPAVADAMRAAFEGAGQVAQGRVVELVSQAPRPVAL